MLDTPPAGKLARREAGMTTTSGIVKLVDILEIQRLGLCQLDKAGSAQAGGSQSQHVEW